jgi:outer membrane protein TolC
MNLSRQAASVVALLAITALSLAARPCTAGLSVVASDSALARTVEELSGSPLSLDDAMSVAIEHSPALQQAEAQLRASLATLQRERGFFDPELFANVERSSDDTPAASPFAGADVVKTDQTQGAFGARVTLPTGTELEASLNTTRLKTNSSFSTLNPEIDANGLISVRQPLLEGFGRVARREVRAAERAAQAALARREEARLSLVEDIESRYWDVYAAERNLAVLRLIRQQASALLDEVKVRHQAGMVGPNEVENARAFLAQQELAALDGEEQLDASCDRLHQSMGLLDAAAERIHPTDRPPTDEVVPDLDTLSSLVEAENLQLQAERADLEATRTRARAAGWGAWPSLDALGTLGGRGLAGQGQDVSFGGQTFPNDENSGLGDSWSQVVGRDFPNWSLGLELSLPLGAREGRGERDRLRAEVARQEASLRATELRLETDLRDVQRTLRHSQQRREIAERGVDASRQQLRIGLIEYENGRSTAFELVRLGADLADAQRRYSDALVRSAKARARLRRLTSDHLPSRTN